MWCINEPCTYYNDGNNLMNKLQVNLRERERECVCVCVCVLSVIALWVTYLYTTSN